MSNSTNDLQYLYIEDSYSIIIRRKFDVRNHIVMEVLTLLFLVASVLPSVALVWGQIPFDVWNVLLSLMGIGLACLIGVAYANSLLSNVNYTVAITKHGAKQLLTKEIYELAWNQIKDYGVQHEIICKWRHSPKTISVLYFSNTKMEEAELREFLAKGAQIDGDIYTICVYFNSPEEADSVIQKINSAKSLYDVN